MESNFLEKYFGSWIEGKPPKDKAVLVTDGFDINYAVFRDESKFGGGYLEPLGVEESDPSFLTMTYEKITHWMPVRPPSKEIPS